MFTLVRFEGQVYMVPIREPVDAGVEVVGVSFYNLETFCLTDDAVAYMHTVQGTPVRVSGILILEDKEGRLKVVPKGTYISSGDEWPVALVYKSAETGETNLSVAYGVHNSRLQVARFIRDNVPQVFALAASYAGAEMVRLHLNRLDFELEPALECSFGEVVLVRLEDDTVELASVIANVDQKIRVTAIYGGESHLVTIDQVSKIIQKEES